MPAICGSESGSDAVSSQTDRRRSSAQLLFEQGSSAHKAGDLSKAGVAFAAAARAAPDWPDPVFSRCLILLERAAPAAVEVLQDLLVRFPDHAAGWEAIGQALLRARKAEAALACFERAARIEPDFARVIGYGSALRMLGRVAEAGAAFAEACRLDPKSERAPFLFALCAQDLHDYPTARDGYQRALANNPGLAEANVNLGTVLQATGDLDGAKQAYGAALRQRADTFGRVSQAMTGSPKGELWLDLGRLRRELTG